VYLNATYMTLDTRHCLLTLGLATR
jgi:hypothetical protein